jgi:hypothetical protein
VRLSHACLAIVVAVVVVTLPISSCSVPCTQSSCPLNQLCAGDGRCVNPPTPPHEGGEGEGEGEGTAGEGEGEGEGANLVCGDPVFSGDYAKVFMLGAVNGASSTQALASIANPGDYAASVDHATRPTIALDGSIILLEGSGATLGFHKFVAEAHVASGPKPSDCNFDGVSDATDDAPIATNKCNATTTPPFKVLLKGGSSTDYAYQCLNDPNLYDSATGNVLYTISIAGTDIPRAYAANGTFFVDDGQSPPFLSDATGAQTQLSFGTEPYNVYLVRESQGTFLAAVEDQTGANAVIDGPINLFKVTTTGTVTNVGTYQGITGAHVTGAVAIDKDGNLFLADINGVVTEYTTTAPPGAPVYDPSTLPVGSPSALFSGGTVAGF